MTNDDTEFLNHIWHVLGYDNSEGAPPIHEQFYERHKDIIQTGTPQHIGHGNRLKNMTDEQRVEHFKMKRRENSRRAREKLLKKIKGK